LQAIDVSYDPLADNLFDLPGQMHGIADWPFAPHKLKAISSIDATMITATQVSTISDNGTMRW
jgi:hypothetical protein